MPTAIHSSMIVDKDAILGEQQGECLPAPVRQGATPGLAGTIARRVIIARHTSCDDAVARARW